MSRKSHSPTDGVVVNLCDSLDFQPDETGTDEIAPDSETTLAALESLFSNPRFSMPANDETVFTQPDRPAPVSQAARPARLIRIWFEEMAGEVEASR